jgi:hypothetical protein
MPQHRAQTLTRAQSGPSWRMDQTELQDKFRGAFLGSRLIPPVWRREVEGWQLMRRLADTLLLAAEQDRA